MEKGQAEAELSQLVKALTSSGHTQDKQKYLKKLKMLCRSSDDLLKHTHDLIMTRLEEDDAEVRIGVIHLADQLFRRSHLFRVLLLDDFQKFLDLVLETNADLPLPGTKAASENLKEKALTTIEQWHDKFSTKYKVLALAFKFIKNYRQAQRRTNEQPAWAQRLLQEILNRSPDVDLVITQMENCFRLLVPDDMADKQMNSQLSSEPTTSRAERLRDHAMPLTFSLEIQVPTVVSLRETSDNADVLDNLRRLHRELTGVFLPMVKKWLRGLAKITHPPNVLRSTIDLKSRIEATHEKFGELQVGSEASSDASDLEEVPDKEGYEPVIPVNRRAEYGLEPLKPLQQQNAPHSISQKKALQEESDPTSREAQLQRLGLQSGTTVRGCADRGAHKPPSAKDLMEAGPSTSQVPTRNFDIDLLYWEQEKVEAPLPNRVGDLNCVWRGAERDEDAILGQELAFRERRIDFSGEFVPVKWTCRARLPSGKLCPRRDRHKCPLHGLIVARDELGNPSEPNAPEVSTPAVPDWQEPGLLRDLEAATGVELTVGRRRKKQPLPRHRSNPRARLEKKIFNKRSVRRVAQTMDTIDGNKFMDKFGDQWNYAFGT